MGGRSSTSGGRVISAERVAVKEGTYLSREERKINRTSFTNEGGQWTLDINGVGGVQILDERDSSRAGFGSGPAYGITVWDANYRMDEQQIYYTSLNEAKQIAKSLLKDKLTGR